MSEPLILRSSAASLARQIGAGKGSAKARRLGEEIAQAIMDGQIPEEVRDGSGPQFCTCTRPIQESRRRPPFVALGCMCGEVWHRRPGEARLIAGHPPGKEEL